MEARADGRSALETLRRFLLLLFAFGVLGTGGELLLVGHCEDAWQWTPLVLMGLSLPLTAWLLIAPSARLLRAWQALMLLFLLGGLAGIALHWKGTIEFQQESNPSLSGAALYREAAKSVAPPALAPGAMIQLALLGWACAWRHPGLEAISQATAPDKGGAK
jgi:hypothetical protein